jgi:hypothetical protein
MSSDFLGSIECVPQMVIFDVVSQDLNILKQSAFREILPKRNSIARTRGLLDFDERPDWH